VGSSYAIISKGRGKRTEAEAGAAYAMFQSAPGGKAGGNQTTEPLSFLLVSFQSAPGGKAGGNPTGRSRMGWRIDQRQLDFPVSDN
jgi:hypothetical protein